MQTGSAQLLRSLMIPEIDTRRCAKLLIDQHGEWRISPREQRWMRARHRTLRLSWRRTLIFCDQRPLQKRTHAAANNPCPQLSEASWVKLWVACSRYC